MSGAAVEVSELRLKWRHLKDSIARYGVAIGGLSVIAAVLLIFFYLFYVVVPLFLPAQSNTLKAIERPGTQTPSLYTAVEEQAEVAFRITSEGSIVFYELADGRIRDTHQVSLPLDAKLTTVTPVNEVKGILALGTDQGDVLVIQHSYKITFPDDVRLITPQLTYPYGSEWIKLAEEGSSIQRLAVRENSDRLLIAAGLDDGRLVMMPVDKAGNLFGDEVTLTPSLAVNLNAPLTPDFLVMSPLMDWLYAASGDGRLAYYDIRNLNTGARLLDVLEITENADLTALNMLSGGISLIAGDARGGINQWFPVRDDNNNYHLRQVRDFAPMGQAPITLIEAESGRRGFIVADDQGKVGVYYSTSGSQVLTIDTGASAINVLAVSPRADMLLTETAGGSVLPVELHNEHPEISWSALWGKVWYESYAKPEFIWQSSAASNDFEPKFSLVPLSFGTLKAAFYAMLFAMPLAIMGAIYTAYFMAPEMRRTVKPTIEVMEALPTVILGFLAGLWLAPMVENNLPGIFTLLIFLPLAMLSFGFGWTKMPRSLRHRVPDGWHAALLVPVLVLFTLLCFQLSRPIELLLFNGNMPLWLDKELGISYDQRNALVVGLAMGFAVIPTIFSIAEDAIFSVPKHLSNGSLALGATPWQTLVRVVLPTASPGIFSSVMIGMGRAVGETMIVLMATGNTPVMDASPFQGMRTLSANIAVEMPESEVGSSHFRILFLAGLVLFLFTFFFNTMAELVRQRLREKYSNL